MAHSLNVHHYRYPDLLRVDTEQGLLTVVLLIVTILVIAIVVAGVSLVQETSAVFPLP